MKGKNKLKAAVVLLFVCVCGVFFFRWNMGESDNEKQSDSEVEVQLGKEDSISSETVNLTGEESSPESTQCGMSCVEKTALEATKEVEEGSVRQELAVYVCGAVKQEGVYYLPEGSRVVDALLAAGGLRKEAAGSSLNQAAFVSDSMRLYVPTKEEVKEAGGERAFYDQTVTGQAGSQTTGTKGEACVTGGTSSAESECGKININTAGKDLLMTLPGIGESKADAIIAYRTQNGTFGRAEDLMQVPGIKEGVFQKVEQLITVE